MVERESKESLQSENFAAVVRIARGARQQDTPSRIPKHTDILTNHPLPRWSWRMLVSEDRMYVISGGSLGGSYCWRKKEFGRQSTSGYFLRKLRHA